MVQPYVRVCASHPTPSGRLTYPYNSSHNLTEATREMVKKSTDDVKNLTSFPAGGQFVSYSAFRYESS
jgi:YD repeat-containing protein